MAYVRTVKTSSGATAVQIVWSSRRGSRSIEHIGSAHDEAGLAALEAAAAERLAAGQAERDLGVAGRPGSEPLPITCSRSALMWKALCRAYAVLGFDKAAGGDEVFRQLVFGADHRAVQQGRLAARDRGNRRGGIARRYRIVHIKAGSQILTAAAPLSEDLRHALIKIRADGVH